MTLLGHDVHQYLVVFFILVEEVLQGDFGQIEQPRERIWIQLMVDVTHVSHVFGLLGFSLFFFPTRFSGFLGLLHFLLYIFWILWCVAVLCFARNIIVIIVVIDIELTSMLLSFELIYQVLQVVISVLEGPAELGLRLGQAETEVKLLM